MREPENVQSVMLEILKRIQADVSDLKVDVSGLKVDVSGLKVDVSGLKVETSGLKTDMADLRVRLDRLEAIVRRQGRDSAAMLVMMRGTVGVYDERLKTIEEDVRLLMEHGATE